MASDDTPKYQEGVSIATFYGCRGRNNKNTFSNIPGTWACRKNSTYRHLHFMGAVKQCKTQPSGLPPLTRRICHVNAGTKNNMLNIVGFTQKCSVVEPFEIIAEKTCYQEASAKTDVKKYTVFTCKFRGAASFADLIIGVRDCPKPGITANNLKNVFGYPKPCRTYEPFILVGRTKCVNSFSFNRVTIGKTRTANCNTGELVNVIATSPCHPLRFFDKNVKYLSGTRGCRIYNLNVEFSGTYLCGGKHSFVAPRTMRVVSFLCRTYPITDWKTQTICRHLLSSPFIPFKFGRVNGGRPASNFFVRTSGRIEGRITQ